MDEFKDQGRRRGQNTSSFKRPFEVYPASVETQRTEAKELRGSP
jgi:hypothetical protein